MERPNILPTPKTTITTTTTTTTTDTSGTATTTTTTSTNDKLICPVPNCTSTIVYSRKQSLNKHINSKHPEVKHEFIDQTKISDKNKKSTAINTFLHSLKLALDSGVVLNGGALTLQEQKQDALLIEAVKDPTEDLSVPNEMATYLEADEANFVAADPRYVYTHHKQTYIC